MDKLVPPFANSLFNPAEGTLASLAEVGLDSVLEDGLLKDLPIVGSIIGVAKVSQKIYERNLLAQTLTFIKTFNSGILSEDKLSKYKNKIFGDSRKAESELGRVLLLLNRCIDLEKSKMFGKLFREYVDSTCSWDEFCEFSDITERIFISDIKILSDIKIGILKKTSRDSAVQVDRLSSLGLLFTSISTLMSSSPESPDTLLYVRLSSLGQKYCAIILND